MQDAHVVCDLVAKRIPNQNHVNTVCGIASAGDDCVAAHALR